MILPLQLALFTKLEFQEYSSWDSRRVASDIKAVVGMLLDFIASDIRVFKMSGR